MTTQQIRGRIEQLQGRPEPPDIESAKECWLGVFDTALYAIIDEGIRRSEVRAAVALAALVADEALDQIEQRWPR